MRAGTGAECRLCGATAFRTQLAYDAPDAYERAVGITAENYLREWVQCEGCGVFFSRYSRPANALEVLYVSKYRSEGAEWRSESTERTFRRVVALPREASETKQRVSWIKEELERLERAGIVERGPPPYRLLDIGGATGVFAYEFRDAQWEPHVVDPSEAGRFIQTELGISYRQEFYEPGRAGVDFDLVSLVFVLEHLADPAALLGKVKADLKPRGLVYVEVPDALAFARVPPGDEIFNSCHLWMFTPSTLARLFAASGLEVFSVRRTRIVRGHYAVMMLGGLP